MKVAIGAKIQNGPWGGGNQFANSLNNYLLQRGVNVVFDLKSKDVDIILLTEPRSNLKISAFSDIDIIKYLMNINKNAIVVHRINECDERKGTKMVNELLSLSNRCADYTVFISNWLREKLENQRPFSKKYSVVLNGADTNIFNNKKYIKWNKNEKIKIVTHHWGGNWMKGFDVYKHLDNLLGMQPYKDMMSFTYIGYLPNGFEFNNSTYIQPLSNNELAHCLSQHHIYLTGSQNEPAGMHHIEGALCGLPILYRNSGALPEYCNGYGVMFDSTDFEEKLWEIRAKYDFLVNRMKSYPYTADEMCKSYYDLFLQLLDQQEQLISQRIWNQIDGYKMVIKSSLYKLKYRFGAYFGKT